jgi:hypothetical protein
MAIPIGEYKQAVEALAQRMKAFYDKAIVDIEKEWKKNYIPGSKFANEIKALAEETNQEIDSSFVERYCHKAVMSLMLKFLFLRFAEDKRILKPYFRNEAIEKWKRENKNSREVIKEAFENAREKFKGLYKITPYDEFLPSNETLEIYLIDALSNEPQSGLYKDEGSLDFATLDPRVVSAFYEKLFDRKKRKELGLFFTPPVIAEYLVEKAFEGQKITKDFLVLDPACGSGQILLAVYRKLKDIFVNQLGMSPGEAHKQILSHNLWGIDVEPFAVLLSKINLAIQDLENVPEYINIIHGDSLLETGFDIPQIAMFKDVGEGQKQKLIQETIRLQGGKEITVWRNGFGRILLEKPIEQKQLFELVERMKTGIFSESGIRTMKDLPKEFDAVVANPPYISFGLRGVGKISKQKMIELKNRYPNSAEYKLAIYSLFFDLGIRKLKEKAKLCYISPDSFLLGRYFSKLRVLILSKCKIEEILLFKEDFWESGVVGCPVITTLKKESDKKERDENIMNIKLCKSLDDFLDGKFIINQYNQVYFFETYLNRFRLFFNEKIREICSRIEKIGTPLGKIININSGLIGKGGQNRIISRVKKGKLWLPGIVSGSEINRYSIKWQGNFLLYDKDRIHSGYKCVDYFSKKIFLRQTGDKLICAIDNNGFLCLNNLHVGNLKDKKFKLEYLVILLNSQLLNFYYQSISLETGRTMAQTDIETIEQLPIYFTHQQNPFIEMADKMLELNKKLQETEKSFYEFVEEKIKNKIPLREIEGLNFVNIKDSRAKLGEKGKINATQEENTLLVLINKKPVIKIICQDKISSEFLSKYLNGLRTNTLSGKDGDSWIERILNTKIHWDKKLNLEKLLEEYKSLQSSAEELKKQIAETDREIDEMVYDLYGITKEERKIIEESFK